MSRRTCKQCGRIQPSWNFRSRYICKDCAAVQSHARYLANRDRILATQQAYRERCKARWLEASSPEETEWIADPRSIDDAYVQLAACILRLAFDRYRRILCRCARGDATEAEVQAIEHELCTPYYAALSLHRVDLPVLCQSMREEAGLPEQEESE